MKKRNFYPNQVLRALEGKTVQELDSGRLHALHYFMRKSRKMNQMIAVLSDVKNSDLDGVSEATARTIFENANSRIYLKLPKAASGFTSRLGENGLGLGPRYHKRMDGEGGGGPANTPPDKITRPGH